MWYTDPVATQNLTLAIKKDILLEARKYALEHGTSVNGLVRESWQGSAAGKRSATRRSSTS